MEPFIILCPQCEANLKLRDRSLLGKTGKCPQCSFRFVLTEPQEVELELAETSLEPAPPVDEPRNFAENFTENFTEALPTEAEPIDIAITPESGGARLQALRRRERRSSLWLTVVTLMLLAGGGVYFLVTRENDAKQEVRNPDASPPKPTVAEIADSAEPLISEAIEQGPPIDLQYLPHGAGLLIHLRPAEIWAADSVGNAARTGLSQELNNWLTEKITGNSLFPPEEIEELKICLIYGSPGEPAGTAGVVTLSAPIKRSEMLERFQANRQDDIGRSYYVGKETSYLMIDDRTFAFCPTTLVKDWRETIDRPATTRESLTRILRQTDRNDQFTVVFEPADLRLHGETLFPATAQRLLQRTLNWFNSDVETVCWGVRLEKQFHSRVVLLKRTASGMSRLQREVARKLAATPQQVYTEVARMNPQRLGPKRVIGRFPAMTLAFQRGTRISRQQQSVVLETTLPVIAAANLTLGTMLTWRESTRMNTNPEPADIVAGTPISSPKGIAERLQMKIACDFRRTPLHEALDYISKEIGVPFELAGDDLKLIGITQNMSQEFKMDNVPATAILDRMLSKIGLVIVIDRTKNNIKVTSSQAAGERGETPFPLAPLK